MDVDKTVVMSGNWINAAIINASQYILNKQFEAKFQDVGYAMTMNYSIVESGFIQIIHDSSRNHWVTISNLDSSQPENVLVFDSMFCHGSPSMKAQVACLLHTSKSEFTLSFVNVHKQTGCNDCGLFSIAYAVALCLGENPGTLVFDQSEMRNHLVSCIEQQCFSMFPIRGKRRKNLKVKKTERVSVYCLCRMPDMPHQPPMICCSKCSEWYHGDVCISPVPESAWEKNTRWSCPSCVEVS